MELTRRRLLIGGAAAGAAGISVARLPSAHLLGLSSLPKPAPTRGRVLNVRQFGARGDGRADDRTAVQAGIDALAGAGGGTLLIPAGVYVVSADPTDVAVTLKSGVTLAGEGSASVLKLHDGSGGHLVNAARVTECGVQHLVLDGNRDRQPPAGHCFRSGDVVGLRLRNAVMRNAYSYGIGLQSGTHRDVLIDNVLIEDCGADGIDLKNRHSNNSNVTITNVTVRRWGLRSDKDKQAGIDCRGRVRLANITIGEPGAEDAVGVRMRQGEIGSGNGLGAHHSTLQGFDIRMGQGRAQIGVAVVARSVTVSSGSVSGGFRGLLVQDSGFRGSAVRVSGCSGAGILIDAFGRGLDGDGALLSECIITGCADGIDVEADDVQIVRCVSRNNRGHGLIVRETSDRLRVLGGDFSGNRSGPILNSGRAAQVTAPVS